ncbi:MAG: polysaccharide deacetylase family protein [Clostridia bacterium]
MYKSRGKRGRRNSIGLGKFVIGGTILLALLLLFMPISVENKNAEVEVGTEFKANPKVTYFGIDISKYVKTTGNVNTSKVGEYNINYKWGIKSKTTTISVIDKTAPVIHLQGAKTVYAKDSRNLEGAEKGVTVTDNYDKDIKVSRRDTNKISDTEYEFVYTAIDSSGNMSIAKRKIVIATGVICLTFDDGPSSVTPEVLDVLKENNIKATFFILDYSEQSKSMIQRIIDEGHTLAIHGMSHDYSKIYASAEATLENFTSLQKKIKKDFNYDVKYVRFPGGASNTISRNYCEGVMTEAVKKVQEESLEYYDWNVDVDDAGSARTPSEIYNNFVDGILPGVENIVLMHDGEGHMPTAKALQEIINYAKENGYVFTAISENTTPAKHSVNN